MTTDFSGQSAKIIPFPARGRFAVGGARNEPMPAADLSATRVAKAAYGSAWYHEAAIQEAEQDRKN